jgi:RNA polymerase-binding protein DksA
MNTKKAKAELIDFRDHLLKDEERFADSLAVSLEEQAGEEAYDQHIGDVGNITLEREMDESLQDNAVDLLNRVNRALEKIEEGTYGICDVCGLPIDEGRLEAEPYATLCIKDQKLLETGRI